MSEVEKAIEITKEKNICEFCIDCGIDEICIKCTKVHGRNITELEDYYNIVISTLREKANREKNSPLTLKELQKMTGEPIWIVSLYGEFVPQWEITSKPTETGYGKSWLAYRYKLDVSGTEKD
jgi:hypothetical protein